MATRDAWRSSSFCDAVKRSAPSRSPCGSTSFPDLAEAMGRRRPLTSPAMRRAVVISAVRTPIGRYGGALADVRPDDLGALAIGAAVERAGVEPGSIDDVYFGCANQAGEDNRNVARMSSLL